MIVNKKRHYIVIDSFFKGQRVFMDLVEHGYEVIYRCAGTTKIQFGSEEDLFRFILEYGNEIHD